MTDTHKVISLTVILTFLLLLVMVASYTIVNLTTIAAISSATDPMKVSQALQQL